MNKTFNTNEDMFGGNGNFGGTVIMIKVIRT